MSIAEKVKLQRKFGPIHIKNFQESNPFVSDNDSDAGNSLNNVIRWCDEDFNDWVSDNPNIIIINRHYSTEGFSCLLSVDYLIMNH